MANASPTKSLLDHFMDGFVRAFSMFGSGRGSQKSALPVETDISDLQVLRRDWFNIQARHHLPLTPVVDRAVRLHSREVE